MQYDPLTKREIVYTEFGVAQPNAPYPLTVDNLGKGFAKFQADMYKQEVVSSPFRYEWSDLMKHCMVEIRIFDSNGSFTSKTANVISGRRYETPEMLCGAINAVATTDGSGTNFNCNVVIKIYNIISGDVPTVNRILGYNHYYQSVCGGKMFTRENHLDGNSSSFNIDKCRVMVIDAFEKLFGATISTAQYNASPLDYDACVWMQRTKNKNAYALPPVGENISIRSGELWGYSGKQRQSLNLTTMNVVTNASIDEFRIVNAYAIKLNQNYGQDTALEWLGNIKRDTSWYSEDASFLMVYGLQNGDRRAIYLKPLGGIDTICVGRFDPNLYRLEAVFSSPIGGHRQRYRIIPVPQGDGAGNATYTGRIHRSLLFAGGGSRNWGRGAKNKDMGWDMRFYLRKLDTDFVSPVSNRYVRGLLNYNKASGLDFLIGYDQ